MSKVLVDRELLDQLQEKLDPHRDAVLWGEVCDAIRRAQPAETEGDRIASGFVILDGMAFSKDEILAQRFDLCNALESLSVVTAERDRLLAELERAYANYNQVSYASTERGKQTDQLRAEAEALRVALFGIASVNPAERGIEWAKSYASDGLKGAGSELYARWLEAFKEAEALRALLNKALPVVEAHAGASHMLEGFRPTRNKWDELVDGIRAAMAAKEA